MPCYRLVPGGRTVAHDFEMSSWEEGSNWLHAKMQVGGSEMG